MLDSISVFAASTTLAEDLKTIWKLIPTAVEEGNIEAVKQHITAGTDVNAKNPHGWTPLHAAALWGHNDEVAELLIANGADVNATDKHGRTPLHYAATNGHKEIAELLIAKGAEVNAKDGGGRTPLNSGTWFRGNKETGELLIAAGADVKAGDGLKRTPLDWAVAFDQTEIADLFRKCGGKTREELKAERK